MDNIEYLIISIIVIVISVGLTFYIKDYLQKKSDYKRLRKKLEKFAGKNATILYSPSNAPGFMGSIKPYKITEIDEQGITIKDELETIFIPADKLLKSDLILPCEDYQKAKLMRMKKEMEEFMDAMMPALFDKMFPAMMKALEENILMDEGEIGAVIGVKIEKVLKDEGYEIKKLTGKDNHE